MGIPEKMYLGDSVYVEMGSFLGEIVLTTDNGRGPTNRIVMEPQVVEALLRYYESMTATTNKESG